MKKEQINLKNHQNIIQEINKKKIELKKSEVETELYYKNENKLACIVKELPDLNAGEYEVNMSISINGIQWTNVEHKILYLAPEDGLSFDDIIKLDAANDKNKKKKK